MSMPGQVLFGVLVVIGYFGSPIGLLWGWQRFVSVPRQRSLSANLSLAGFLLASASGLLAFASVLYAHVHTFRYYDPVLMRIYRTGFLLSLGGIVVGISGMWKPSSLRWHAPACGLTTAVFWLMAVTAE